MVHSLFDNFYCYFVVLFVVFIADVVAVPCVWDFCRRRGDREESSAVNSAGNIANGKPPPQVHYTLTSDEAAADVLAIHRGLNGNAGGVPSASSVVDMSSVFLQNDVGVQRGVLHIAEHTFSVGDKLHLSATRAPDGASAVPEWVGVIVLLSPNEVRIESADGRLLRFPVTKLRNGAYKVISSSASDQQQGEMNTD